MPLLLPEDDGESILRQKGETIIREAHLLIGKARQGVGRCDPKTLNVEHRAMTQFSKPITPTTAVRDYGQGRAYRRKHRKVGFTRCQRCLEFNEMHGNAKFCGDCRVIVDAESRRVRKQKARKEQTEIEVERKRQRDATTQARHREYNRRAKPYGGRVINSSDIMHSPYGVTDRLIQDILDGKVGLSK